MNSFKVVIFNEKFGQQSHSRPDDDSIDKRSFLTTSTFRRTCSTGISCFRISPQIQDGAIRHKHLYSTFTDLCKIIVLFGQLNTFVIYIAITMQIVAHNARICEKYPQNMRNFRLWRHVAFPQLPMLPQSPSHKSNLWNQCACHFPHGTWHARFRLSSEPESISSAFHSFTQRLNPIRIICWEQATCSIRARSGAPLCSM